MQGEIDWTNAYKTIVDGESQQKFIEMITAGGVSLNDALGLSKKIELHLEMLRLLVNLTVNNGPISEEVYVMLTNPGQFDDSRDFFDKAMSCIDGKRLFLHLLVNIGSKVKPIALPSAQQYLTHGHANYTTAMELCLDKSFLYFFGKDHSIDHDLLQKHENGQTIPEEFSERIIKVVENSSALHKYDEWLYLFLNSIFEGFTCLSTTNRSPLEQLLMLVVPADPQTVFTQKLEVEGIHLLEYIFHLLQKTVECKIHYSVVKDIAATPTLDHDEFYAANKQSHLNGLQITKADLIYIVKSFASSCDYFMNLPVEPSSTDHLFLTHMLVKLLIPVTHLGGYNADIQKLVVPDTLERLALLLDFVDRGYYRAKVAIHREASYCLNTDLIRLASNLVHINKPAQDMLVAKKMVAPFLKYTRPDMHNPLSREATIVFVRYLTESNPEAATYVHSEKLFDLDSPDSKLLVKESFL